MLGNEKRHANFIIRIIGYLIAFQFVEFLDCPKPVGIIYENISVEGIRLSE